MRHRMYPRGYFGIGIWHNKTPANLGTLLRAANLYGASFVYTIGKRYEHQSSDTMMTPNHLPLFHYNDLDDLVDHLPHGAPLIGVELTPNARPLSRFVHPERGTYLLGAEDYGLPAKVTERCHQLVQIECPSPWSMNVSAAGSIVLYDRYCKTLKVAS